MAHFRRRSTTHLKAAPLPDWTHQYILLWQFICTSSVIQRWESTIRLERHSGYSSRDVLAFFVAYYCSGFKRGIKHFAHKTRHYGPQLAAIAGRARWPTQASISRSLSSITSSQAEACVQLLLGKYSNSHLLSQHESTVYRDNTGEAWHVFHFDNTVTTLRQRSLPEGEDMPPAKRRSEELARSGYPGRKRGEVQFSRGMLQHSGTGQWLHMTLAEGNGALKEELSQSYEAIEGFCSIHNLSPERCIVLTDGVGNGWTQVSLGCASKVQFLTRLGDTSILLRPEVSAYLTNADWQKVEDSCSGVTRFATEFGTIKRGKDWHARVVVSRFKCRDGVKHGAGRVLNEWQYELYGTALDPMAFGAPEVVTLYYGRCGQENRFAQEDRELGLDHVFSYHAPAQQLVSAIGLWVYNQRIAGGAVAVGGLRSLDYRPVQRTYSSTKLPGYEVGNTEAQKDEASSEAIELRTAKEAYAQEWEAPSASSDQKAPAVGGEKPEYRRRIKGVSKQREEVRMLVKRLNWRKKLEPYPGWSWNQEHEELLCPAMKEIPLHDARISGQSSLTIRFRGRHSDCSECSLRPTCSPSKAAQWRQERSFTVPLDEAIQKRVSKCKSTDTRQELLEKETKPLKKSRMRAENSTDWSAPVVGATEGTHALSHPQLRPAVLRRKFDELCEKVTIELRVTYGSRMRVPDYLATSPANRQCRRHTWQERQRWNALADVDRVELSFAGPPELQRLRAQSAMVLNV